MKSFFLALAATAYSAYASGDAKYYY